jgi:hypothetical protein
MHPAPVSFRESATVAKVIIFKYSLCYISQNTSSIKPQDTARSLRPSDAAPFMTPSASFENFDYQTQVSDISTVGSYSASQHFVRRMSLLDIPEFLSLVLSEGSD